VIWSVRRDAVSGDDPDGSQGVPARRRHADFAEAWCEIVETGRGGRLAVRGRSMVPTLLPGWSVSVQPVIPTRLRTGDVAVFFHGPKLFVHRIVVCICLGRWSVLVEQGDACRWARRLRAEAVLGRVVGVFDGRSEPVPRHHWRWSRTRRLRVAFVVFTRLAAVKILAKLKGVRLRD